MDRSPFSVTWLYLYQLIALRQNEMKEQHGKGKGKSKVKGRGNVHPITGQKGPEVE